MSHKEDLFNGVPIFLHIGKAAGRVSGQIGKVVVMGSLSLFTDVLEF